MDLFNKGKVKNLNDQLSKLDSMYLSTKNELKEEKSLRKTAEQNEKAANEKIVELEKTMTETTEANTAISRDRDLYLNKCTALLPKYKSVSSRVGGLTKEVNKLKNKIVIVNSEKAELSNTNKLLIKERDEATELARKLTEENQKLKNKPAVPNIKELTEYKENPKKYSRNRKGKLVNVNN